MKVTWNQKVTKYVMNVSQLMNELRNNFLTQQSHFHTINATTVN